MSKNVEHMLRNLGRVTVAIGIIDVFLLFCYFMFLFSEIENISILFIGILAVAIVVFMTVLGACLIYALAQIVEDTKKMRSASVELNNTISLVFRKERQMGVEENQRHIEEQKRQQEEVERIKAEEEQKQKEREEVEKRAKQERFVAYWKEHEEDRQSLLAKKTEAEKKLKQIGPLAQEERKTIQGLIRAIEEELSKDR